MKYKIDKNGHCTILDSVTFIGDGAFLNCSALKQIKMPEHTITIINHKWVGIGCKVETIDWWVSERGADYGRLNDYTEEEITLYQKKEKLIRRYQKKLNDKGE